ncbi:hypothetical protein CRYUN_Cryun01aG0056300 [Craigia yunnanensis]
MSREKHKRATLPPIQENIDKLEKSINERNFYGAQQMYKSISARYVSAQRYSEALDLLHSGACLQLKHGQVTCGAELAVLFVETLVKGKIPYDEDILDRVRKIYKVFPQIPVPSNLEVDDDVQELTEALGAAKTRVEGCSSFLRAAIKWSAEFGAHRNGDPQLHVMLAEYIYSESPELLALVMYLDLEIFSNLCPSCDFAFRTLDMARVSYYFVRGNNLKMFVSTLVNFMGKCYPGEDDMAVARAVLLYLSVGNLQDANCLMDELKRQVASQELDFPRSDLIQFITFLLLTLERDALPLFNMLRVNYKSNIDREPAFNELLDDIAEKFYGVQRRNPLQGMFGDLFKRKIRVGMARSNGEWPEDLLTEILLKLPVKSIIRFRCVAKPWCALFKNPSFVSLHRGLSKRNNYLLVNYRDDNNEGKVMRLFVSYHDLRQQFPCHFAGKSVFHFCIDNGLFCLCDPYDSRISLWNPATREFRILPECNQNIPPSTLGFGLDSLSNDYKVIYFRTYVNGETYMRGCHHAVYRMSTGSWRVLKENDVQFFRDLRICPNYNNACVNGVYYWQVFKSYPSRSVTVMVLAFHLGTEVFKLIKSPIFGHGKLLPLHDGRISIWDSKTMERSIEIWVLNYERHWTKLLKIDPLLKVERMFGFWKNGKVFVESESGQLLLL